MRFTFVNRSSTHFTLTSARRALKAAAFSTGTEDLASTVFITFIEDPAIRELNRMFRGIDQVTDVLSFPYRSSGGFHLPPRRKGTAATDIFGEIIIAADQAARQARRRRHSIDREVGQLLIHGYLHLIGHDHQSLGERQRMRGWEDRIRRSWNSERQ